MYRRVLVPLDGSPLAEQVLPYAAHLARGLGLPLHLLQVLPAPPGVFVLPWTVEELAVVGERALPRLREQARQYLEGKAEGLKGEGLQASWSVREGSPPQEIVQEAGQVQGTLVAMTTHGYTGLVRAFLGSVAGQVLHTLGDSLLLLRARPREEFSPPPRLERVTVALDGSPLAEQVLPYALPLAQGLRIPLALVQVIPAPPQSLDFPWTLEELTVMGEQALPRLRQRAEDYLRGKAEELGRAGAEVFWTVKEGNPPQEIGEEARKHPMSIVAMTTHGRTGLGRWLLGSVTERVLQTSPAPVLVVRAR